MKMLIFRAWNWSLAPTCLALVATLVMTATVGIIRTAPAHAQVDRITEIVVQGTQRIDDETVTAYLTVGPGDPFDPARLDESLKALFATELFADVTIGRDGSRLLVAVIENPVINRIAFEGNKRVKNEDLENEIELRPRLVFTRTKVQQDVQRILKIYQRSGRFASKISPKVLQLDQNRVDLVFEIDEGPLSRIRKIVFIGNRTFSDSDLHEAIQTKEYAFWRILTTTDTYDPDRLGYDRELLRLHYLRRGHADFKVISAIAELTPDREGFVLTFTVEEGERYKFGKIDIDLQLKRVNRSELHALITTSQGNWYDVDEVEDSIAHMTDKLGTLGYAFVDIRPQLERDVDERVIDVTYIVSETARVYVERINIEGNVRTLDEVIRREIQLVEGDSFNSSKLRQSRRRIGNLGFFRKVEVRNREGSAPDQTIIEVVVEEQSTGQISFGVGLSSLDGVLGDIGVSERNLLGRGQELSVKLQASQRTQQFDLSFTEPYFLDRNVAAGVDLFRITREGASNLAFDEKEIGGGVRLGYELATDLRQNLHYNLKEGEIRGVSDSASRFIRQQVGSRVISEVGQSLTLDKRDSRIDPSEGYYLSMSNSVAGLGGSARFIKTKIRGGYYFPILDDYVIQTLVEGGNVIGLGEDVGIVDRYFVGGRNLRGFAQSGIGPRDVATNDALGGNLYYTGTVELSFPVGLPEELGLKASIFSDIGSLWSLDESEPGIFDENSIRASVGVGVGWQTALGLIRIDFAEAVLKEKPDETESIRFSLGTRF